MYSIHKINTLNCPFLFFVLFYILYYWKSQMARKSEWYISIETNRMTKIRPQAILSITQVSLFIFIFLLKFSFMHLIFLLCYLTINTKKQKSLSLSLSVRLIFSAGVYSHVSIIHVRIQLLDVSYENTYISFILRFNSSIYSISVSPIINRWED